MGAKTDRERYLYSEGKWIESLREWEVTERGGANSGHNTQKVVPGLKEHV